MPEINKDGQTYKSGRPKPTLQLAWYGVEKIVAKLLPKAKEMGWKSPSELALALCNGWLEHPTPDPDAKERAPKAPAKAAKKEAKPPKAPAKAAKKEAKPPKALAPKKKAVKKAKAAAAEVTSSDEPTDLEAQKKLQEARRAKARARL